MKKYLYKIGIYPLRLYWFLCRPSTYGVKGVIERNGGKLLFVKTTYGKGHWNFPGGGINRGESPENAIRREALEEVGISLDSIDLLGSFLSTYEYKKDHVTVFLAKTESDVGNLQASEIQDCTWRRKDDPPMPLSRIAVRVLDLIPT